MDRTRWTLLLALAFACGDKEPEGETGDADADADADTDADTDTDTDTVEPIAPSGDRALLYYGNGGFEPDGANKGLFEDVDARWKDQFGWNTDHRNSWSGDLEAFRMIGIVGSTEPFDATQIADLQAASARGTRIVYFADRASCGDPDVAQLLSDLGSTMGLTGSSADQNQIVQTDAYTSGHPITAALTQTLRFKEPCFVDPTGGSAIVRDNNSSVLVGVQRLDTGGDVVVVGDFQFMDDGGYLDHEDNGLLADGLVLVEL
jgi:hypothetical protein